jgi:hypothetical protein
VGGFLSGSAPSPTGACFRWSSATELCAWHDGLRERLRSGTLEEPRTFGSVPRRRLRSQSLTWSISSDTQRVAWPSGPRFAGSWRCSPGDEEVSAARRSRLEAGLTARNRTRRLEGATQAASLPCTGTEPFGAEYHRAASGDDPAFGPGRSPDPETGPGLRATKESGGRSSTSSLPARDESRRRRSADGTPGALVGWNMPTRALEGASP